jgi:ribosomal protein S18 acetylase RimI-like enzyme
MEVRQAKKEDLKGFIEILKEVFPVHNIFTKSEEEVLKYWETVKAEPDDFIVAVEDGKIVGGCLVLMRSFDGHTIARIKHLAVAKDHQAEGTGRALIEKAEEMIGTAKIEIHIAEGEKIVIPFYKKMGYKEEGVLSDHFRKGENCYVMGKYVEVGI